MSATSDPRSLDLLLACPPHGRSRNRANPYLSNCIRERIRRTDA